MTPGNLLERVGNFRDKARLVSHLRHAAVAAACLLVLGLSGHAQAAPAGCAALQAKYPAWKGKTLVNAINPHTPGYEAIDPKDPDKYVGFDIDLGEQIGECLGFKLTYKPVTFAALLTTLSSGQADIVISDIYATKDAPRRPISLPIRRCSMASSSPRATRRRSTASTPRCAAPPRPKIPVSSRFLWSRISMPKCKAEGKPEPTLQLYDNNANCIQAILAGRADTYVNDVNTVDQAVKANPDKLAKAIAVTIPYSVGIAVPKNKPEFRDAVLAALIEIQKAGIHMALLKKWDLDVNNFKEPDILSVD